MLIPILSLLVSSQPTIDKVVIFADRAEVTRGLDVSCGGDRIEAEFPNLPVTLDVRTLRGDATGKAKALGVTSQILPVEADRDVRRGEVKTALQKVQDKLQVLSDGLRNEQEKSQNTSAYGRYLAQVLSEELRNPKPNHDAWKKSLALLEAEETGARKKSVGILAEMRKLEREQAQLATRLMAFDATAPEEARVATVTVSCGGETKIRVKASYVVPGATWHPEYDLRFVTDGGKVGKGKLELTVAAVIQQATGEDWENATLVLSTAKPKLGAQAPELAPLYVEGYQAGSEQTLVQGSEDRSQLQAGEKAAAGGPTGAALEDGGKSFSLTLPGKTTVLSDGRPYWTPVDERTGSGESFLLTIPKLSPYVYQALKGNNPAPYPLLAGRIHIHRNGSYVGDTNTQYIGPGEPLEISLGLDEELAVERIDVKSLDKKPGLFQSRIKLERALAIKVTNRARGAEKLEVREQLPVSKDARLQVELDGTTTKGAKVDAQRGIVSWVIELPKGGSKRLEFAYTILLPEGWKM